ncbi:MAG TPA: sugar ABC transporter substrate-binding protein [Armatimonadaceae bacterium]|nr:sugar ABC transporter substrate-binding protein [Armatimonadaceae bacterium]
MTIRRKALLSLLCAPLAVGLGALALAGCNNNSGTASTGPSPAGGGGAPAAGSGDKIVVAWAEWDPAKQLQKLSEEFTKETGVAVEVQQIPWSDFENKIKLAWSGKDSTYDCIVGDSQWLGKAATSGHYLELTDWAKTGVPVADIAPAALKNYGEYPAGSGKLWAVPCMSDGIAFAYRKDLFDAAAEKTAFQAKYGRPLAPPKNWQEFAQVAEFFTRPDKNLYGAALFYSKEYDGATMGFDQVLWSYGGKLSDGKKAEGVINSPEAVKALEFYAGLKKFCPPGAENFYFSESLTAFQEGKVAMAMNWAAFFPDLVDPAKNKFADRTGYFAMPEGPEGRFVSLGGQGISISAYSKNQDAAKKFVEWFSKTDTQKKWAAMGGLTANTKVAATDEFKKARPYNAVFAETVPHLQDFYNTPEYSELLTPMQRELSAAFSGSKSAKDALDAIAKEHQAILDKAGA